MVTICATMQKAGSLWLLNMLNDLMVSGGGDDFRRIRARYRLTWFVRESGHISLLRFHRLAHLLLPSLLGRTFIVNTHAAPLLSVRWAIRSGLARALYVYRDPRDVARSLYEHGEDLRRRGEKSSTTFDQLMTLEQAIHFTAGLLPAWEAWTSLPGVHITTYEALVNDTASELARICDSLKISAPDDAVDTVVEHYRRRPFDGLDTHFNQGVVGRWREVMTDEQVRLCHRLFQPQLTAMGYDLS